MNHTILSLIEELQEQMKMLKDSEEMWRVVDIAPVETICTAYIEQDRKLREAVAALEKITKKDISGYAGWEDLAESREFTAQEALKSILPLNS